MKIKSNWINVSSCRILYCLSDLRKTDKVEIIVSSQHSARDFQRKIASVVLGVYNVTFEIFSSVYFYLFILPSSHRNTYFYTKTFNISLLSIFLKVLFSYFLSFSYIKEKQYFYFALYAKFMNEKKTSKIYRK